MIGGQCAGVVVCGGGGGVERGVVEAPPCFLPLLVAAGVRAEALLGSQCCSARGSVPHLTETRSSSG